MTNQHNPAWALYIPWLSLGILALYLVVPQFFGIVALLSVGLIASVICAVHHAEVIAHKIGEPFGTLVLALSVTIIEVALIVSMMLSGGDEAMGLARDTIFAAIMIILNGIIGLSLIVGGKKYLVQGFNLEGVTAAIGTMTVIIVFSLILPNYVTSSGIEGIYTHKQLLFVSFITLALFTAFTLFQTIGHREYFLPVIDTSNLKPTTQENIDKPSLKTTYTSLFSLIISSLFVPFSY